MVAELKPVTANTLPLLMEPDRPEIDSNQRTTNSGWKREGGQLVRDYGADDFGALVQHVIVRYLVHGVQRQELAREIQYSERQIQAWISARAGATYGEPVRRALQLLGIGMGRGGVSEASSRRGTEVVAACMGLLADVQWFLDDSDWPRQRELKTLSRLLTAGREPLG